ncbi:hypothetical protein HRbin27_00330 [bacterium HR27]|nr:hypothetical protein HRbin27_00330 [bacterium HR27]
MLAAFVLGMTLTLIGIVIRLLTAIQHRRVGDIVYWSIMVAWTGLILWESLRREETLFTRILPGLPPWAEATLVTRLPVAGLTFRVGALGHARRECAKHASGKTH